MLIVLMIESRRVPHPSSAAPISTCPSHDFKQIDFDLFFCPDVIESNAMEVPNDKLAVPEHASNRVLKLTPIFKRDLGNLFDS